MSAALRAAVIGAGVLGAAVARELASRGAQVTVYEARYPGAGTSGTSFAWVNSRDKAPREYHDLNAAGLRAHAELAALPAPGPRWYFPGCLMWADGATGRLESWGYAVQRISRREALALEPDIRLPDAVDHVVSFPEEGHVLPVVLIGRLLGEAADLGAAYRQAEVTALDASPSSVTLRLADGTVERADVAVCCAGRWTTALAATAGYPVPLADPEAPGSAAVGFLGYTRPAAARITQVLMAPDLNIRPDGGGRLVLQGLDLDSGADPGCPPATGGAVAGELAQRLSRVLRDGEQPVLDAVRVGQRALPADGLTVAGHAGDSGRLYVLATHSGITLSPLLGRLAAGEILGGAPAPLLAPFRPTRFRSGIPVSGSPRPARLPGEQ